MDHLAVLLLRDNISVFSNYKSDEYTWCLLLIVDWKSPGILYSLENSIATYAGAVIIVALTGSVFLSHLTKD